MDVEGGGFIGRYPVSGVLGRGAFGTVYLGTHPDTGAAVAVKVLDRAASVAPGVHAELRASLCREAEALLRVNDPNCVRVYDVIDHGGVAGIVTDFVDGASLRAVLRAHGRLDPRQALVVLDGAISGLVAVHGVGIVHGDVKPDNVLVDRYGVSRLIDFGLAAPAQLVVTGSWASGTPAYLSPEQISTGVTTHLSDIYACAVVLYEVLCGVRPFAGATAEEVLFQHVHAPVPDPRVVEPQVGDELAALCMAGLSKDPAQRPQSAVVFLEWLEHGARLRYGNAWATGAGIGALVGGVIAVVGGAAAPVAAVAGSGAVAGTAGAVGGGTGGVGVAGAAGGGTAGAGAGAGGGAGASASSTGLSGSFGGLQVLVAAGVTTVVVATASIAWIATRDDDEPPAQQVAATPEATPEATAEVVPALNTDIRGASLDDRRWIDEYAGQPVQLRGGQLSISDANGFPSSWTHGTAGAAGKDIYVDLDGDGDEDVIAPLSYSILEDGSTLWYVWVWDADTGRARQLPDPIAADSYSAVCASTVTSIKPDGDAVVIKERVLNPTLGCEYGQDSTIAVTRRVTLEDDIPVLTTGVGGYGGVCPAPSFSTDAYDVATGLYNTPPSPYGGRITLHAGPSEGSTTLNDPQISLYAPVINGLPEGSELPGWLDVDGWEVGHFSARSSGPDGHLRAYGDYQPCAWVKTDSDAEPESAPSEGALPSTDAGATASNFLTALRGNCAGAQEVSTPNMSGFIATYCSQGNPNSGWSGWQLDSAVLDPVSGTATIAGYVVGDVSNGPINLVLVASDGTWLVDQWL